MIPGILRVRFSPLIWIVPSTFGAYSLVRRTSGMFAGEGEQA